MLGQLDLRGRVEISAVAATCRLTINADGTVLSICGDVPAKRSRDFTVQYLGTDAVGDLLLVQTEVSLDLTDETQARVTLDLSKEDLRQLPDEDMDGQSNLQELCEGSDPRG